jgi:hypothetical protein
MENDTKFQSAIIDPNTGQPVLHTGLVPKFEDFPPASDSDWAELRKMLEDALRAGMDPRSPITCSVQSLIMLLRSCELARQEADHFSSEKSAGPVATIGLTTEALGQALTEALPHVRRQLLGRHEQDRADAAGWLERWEPATRFLPPEPCTTCNSPTCWGSCEPVKTSDEELAEETELVERT